MKCATEKLFGAGTASRLRTLFNETKNAYVRLNIPTACPPRAASRSTQGRGFSNLFHLSTPGSLSVGYMYNAGNQRTQEVLTAGNYMGYAYDNIGQLKTAFGKEPGGTTNRMQEQLGYFYDAAGNLNYRTNNALVQTFGVNNLNELTSIGRSGTLTVAGTTTSAATNVTVNTSNAVLYVDNTFASTNQTLTLGTNTFTAIAKDSYGRVDTNTVSPSLPLTDNMDFDLNGNLLQERSTIGGTNRVFAYDDENELIAVWVTNTWKSEFTYDGKKRRRIYKEYTWNGSLWLQTNEVFYIYDGNLVIQERDGNNLPQATYTRGTDLSGSLQHAGGIGGLLARTANSSTLNPQTSIFATAFYHADGNGNVTCLIYTNQTIAAKYEYDPYGNILSQIGPLAGANLYRFSSKEYSQPSGLIYYLYRYYEPNLQRWLNRDPIGEDGGNNLYCMVGNDTIDSWDYLGYGCMVKYTCTLNPGWSRPSGLGGLLINCPYTCTEVSRSLTAQGTTSCDDLPKNLPNYNTDKAVFCQSCPKTITDYQLYMDGDAKANCSRTTCRKGCDLTFGQLIKSKDPAVRAAALLAKIACYDSCNSVCRNP
jgi:RHS repeat-associated protein